MRAHVIGIDDVEEIPVVDGTLRWKPLRRLLGLQAFGMNAYAADAGEQVVERHDETGSGAGGHEEVYVVLRGAARFTVDDEDADAPAGTIVHLPDPAAKRGAVATEDGTIVLAVGGEPGAAYRVSPWESWFAAVPAAERGDHDEAVRIMSEALAEHEGNPALHYNLACQLALGGHPEEALAQLDQARAADPERVARWAARDSDLDSLREREDWPL